jgi:lipopolysaccharide transport system ATP-binding protein
MSVIKVENLSKKYILDHEGQERYTAMRDVVTWKVKKIFSFPKSLKARPFQNKEEFYALKNINFEIHRGDRVGIIGRNGAGKSTLLKVLSRITEPTTGKITINGRVASLLEVGTGFHPELTGRENIYLNGAILGMSRTEIRTKFDEIVDFAGVEKFLDTPVKRYSSGMYVRLAFSVAAHLEPEILIVDEVLAVGDSEFQKKCIGKMEDVSKLHGRTVIFVSHNLAAISALTNNSIYLKNGELINYTTTSNAINEYTYQINDSNLFFTAAPSSIQPSIIKTIVHTSEPNNIHSHGQDIEFEFHVHVPHRMAGICLSFQIFDQRDIACFYNWIFDSEQNICREVGTHILTCKVNEFKLYKGVYSLTVHLAEQKGKQIFKKVEKVCPFEIMMKENHEWGWGDNITIFLNNSKWKSSLLK